MPHDITVTSPTNAQVRKALDLEGFDYKAPAELFRCRIKTLAAHARYRRFDTAAEAVRFAIEDITPASLLGAFLKVEEMRYGVEEIRALYTNTAFPLNRGVKLSESAALRGACGRTP